MSVLIIAEAGVNHNGDPLLAMELARKAKEAGADVIKYQTFIADKLVSNDAKKADYQIKTTGNSSQQEMLRKLELSFDDFSRISEYCKEIGIQFVSTPFDLDSIDFLETLNMPFWKIPSGEITNYPYLVKISKTKRPVILSTGMCSMDEIKSAVDVLYSNGVPELILLHCNTEYPTPYCDVNLNAMNTIKKAFGTEIGYSDHTKGIEIPIAAVAMGATVIEKHFTLDRNMEGPDHKASLEPAELMAMVKSIRNIEVAMGDGNKEPSVSEKKNIAIARKSIVASRNIKCGEVLNEENVSCKRPGNGISPMKWNEVIGTKAKRDYMKDEMID